MSKIIGVTVGTPIGVDKLKEKIKPVTSVNNVKPDESGNVDVKGNSGVYVGAGDMPEHCNVQIDPESDGETLEDMIEAALLKNVGLFKGDTPVRGVDYWTVADKQEIVSEVLATLPIYAGEVESA